MGNAMIELSELTKRYPHKDETGRDTYKTAVENLSLAVGKGEAFGLLGPNGAGKTTTIRMMTLLMEPTSGSICYDGADVRGHEQAIKRLIGVVPQHVTFDQALPVGATMRERMNFVMRRCSTTQSRQNTVQISKNAEESAFTKTPSFP